VNPCQILASYPRHENVLKHRAFVKAHHLRPNRAKVSDRLRGGGIVARKSTGAGSDKISGVLSGCCRERGLTKKDVNGDHTTCGLIYSLAGLLLWAVVGKSKTSTLMCWGSLVRSAAWRQYVARPTLAPFLELWVSF
jgi:hypothetical protein